MKKLSLALFLVAGLSSHVYGLTIKIGVLAPEGTNWSKNLKKMAKEIRKKTDKKVKFKIFFGGSQGDEIDVLRKTRVGQLHGGIFTGKTLGDINGDVRVMEIPFNFNGNREKAKNALTNLGPFFNEGFEEKKFKNLGFFEIGDVYFVSQKKTPNLESLKGVKIWSWDGDKLVDAMIQSMGLISTPLAITDVLSSLSTGIVEAAYAPPMGILALQWNTKIKYLLDLPISYSVGAFLITEKVWKKISPEHQKIVTEIANRAIADINDSIVDDNAEALQAMKKGGIEFLKFPDSDVKQSGDLNQKMVKKLKGNLFSEEAYQKLIPLL